MNTPTPQSQPIDTGISQGQSPQKTAFLANIMGKIPQPVKNIFAKLYANKKVFWLITGAASLILLTIIAGLLFGSMGSKVAIKTTPTPEAAGTPEASPGGDIISITRRQLSSLKIQINGLDVSQSRLKPPAINFDINF